MKVAQKFIIIFALLLFLSPNIALAENVDLTATVQPDAGDADLQFASTPSESTTLSEEQEVLYTITYKLNLSYGSFPFTIVASWDKGVVSGSGTTFDAMDYVVGSASNADDGTPPVVDSTNRTITWSISALTPSATYHNVTYKLKVKSSLPTENQVTVTSRADATLLGSSLPTKTLTHTIQPDVVGPTPTNAPGPTATPGPSATPTPSQQKEIFKFNKIEITQVTDTQAEIYFDTSMESSYLFQYGKEIGQYTDSSSSLTFSKKHTIKLSNLTPDTKYFFIIKAINRSKRTITSDIFTFRTAKNTEELNITASNLSIYSNRTLLSSDKFKSIVIPKSTFVGISLKFLNPEIIKNITAEFKRTDVLGAASDDIPTRFQKQFIETLPGIISSRLEVPNIDGTYDIVFNIQTKNGTVAVKSAPYSIYVSNPLSIIDKNSKKPVEGAVVKIFRYQESYGTLIAIDKSIEFNDTTDYNGFIHVILPSGRYKLEVSATGYKTVEQEIKLGTDTLAYPVIPLNSAFSIPLLIQTYSESIVANADKFMAHLENFSHSTRSLKTTYTFVILMEMILLSAFVYNQKKNTAVKPSFISWIFQFLLLSLIIILFITILVFFLVFLVVQGIMSSYPFLLLCGLNIYIFARLIIHIKEEYNLRK